MKQKQVFHFMQVTNQDQDGGPQRIPVCFRVHVIIVSVGSYAVSLCILC